MVIYFYFNTKMSQDRIIKYACYEFNLFGKLVADEKFEDAKYLIDNDFVDKIYKDSIEKLLIHDKLDIMTALIERDLVGKHNLYSIINRSGYDYTWYKTIPEYYKAWHDKYPPNSFIEYLKKHDFPV